MKENNLTYILGEQRQGVNGVYVHKFNDNEFRKCNNLYSQEEIDQLRKENEKLRGYNNNFQKENRELWQINTNLELRLDSYENIRRGRKGPHQTISEMINENKELKNNQSKIALEKLYAIENILIDMHTNEESFEDISESVSIMVSDMISKLEGGE